MKATIAHALRLAESIPDTPETYRTTRELVAELRELAAQVVTETLTIQGTAAQQKLMGLVAGVQS